MEAPCPESVRSRFQLNLGSMGPAALACPRLHRRWISVDIALDEPAIYLWAAASRSSKHRRRRSLMVIWKLSSRSTVVVPDRHPGESTSTSMRESIKELLTRLRTGFATKPRSARGVGRTLQQCVEERKWKARRKLHTLERAGANRFKIPRTGRRSTTRRVLSWRLSKQEVKPASSRNVAGGILFRYSRLVLETAQGYAVAKNGLSDSTIRSSGTSGAHFLWNHMERRNDRNTFGDAIAPCGVLR